jgi:hypothetical protein
VVRTRWRLDAHVVHIVIVVRLVSIGLADARTLSIRRSGLMGLEHLPSYKKGTVIAHY